VTPQSNPEALTGRTTSPPGDILRAEVLEPQFDQDVEYLLPYLLQVEKVLLTEYERLGVLDTAAVRAIVAALDEIAVQGLTPDPWANLSDLALAVERRITTTLEVPAWHVDRSRNDLQATAQLMNGRVRTLEAVQDLLGCAAAALPLAARYVGDVLPGYTHLQAAQVITPAFFVTAITEHLLHSARRLLATYDGFDLCPLGSGALAGQELDWDRHRMAALLGFAGPHPHALVAVASRSWLVELSAECSILAVGLSRLLTDLMTWAGSEHGLLELPDDLAGISSAMPQKKNYPILERIRGRTAHLAAWHLDVVMAQRNTPYSNSVEVSKESSTQLDPALRSLRSLLRLFTEVLERAIFRTDRARARCNDEYLGGFSLANRLTLDHGLPWRDAQVVAGRYAVAALARGAAAGDVDGPLLAELAREHGCHVADAESVLRDAFDLDAELMRRQSAGSANPDQVRLLLQEHERLVETLTGELETRRATLAAVPGVLARALGAAQDGSGER
jgi:argininosuccinate lyase